MKKIILLVTLFFFFSQIIPYKTIQILCGKEFCVSDNDDDCNEDDFQLKEKKEAEKDIYSEHYFSIVVQRLHHTLTKKQYTQLLVLIPTEKHFFIIVPPPNC